MKRKSSLSFVLCGGNLFSICYVSVPIVQQIYVLFTASIRKDGPHAYLNCLKRYVRKSHCKIAL